MAALQLFILEVIVILFSPCSCYPIYGTKRYGGSSGQRVSSWPPYQMVRTQRYNPLNYYELYPYSQTDDYYPQESYPPAVYYPRTSKYEVYQAVMPYYYGLARPNYGYYEDPVVDLQEEMMQEVEREEREDAQPIGHELLYENEDQDDNLDDVNAAFLQNLIMNEMYKDAISNNNDDDYYQKEWEDDNKKYYNQEDEDVKELKQLAKAKSSDDIHWLQRNNYKKQMRENNNYEKKRSKNNLTERKPTQSSTEAPKTSISPKRDTRGQKEEVLARPATPVRHPFSDSVLDMIKDEERKRTPSVYDTIKHMLDMEKDLENVSYQLKKIYAKPDKFFFNRNTTQMVR